MLSYRLGMVNDFPSRRQIWADCQRVKGSIFLPMRAGNMMREGKK